MANSAISLIVLAVVLVACNLALVSADFNLTILHTGNIRGKIFPVS